MKQYACDGCRVTIPEFHDPLCRAMTSTEVQVQPVLRYNRDMPTKKTAPKAENPKLTKILDEVHTEKQYHGFVDKYAEYMAVHNMGHDPADTHFQDLLCEEEAAQAMYEEKRGWVKVARPILDELKRMKKPLTIREAEKVYDSNPKKWGKPYGS